MVTESGAVVRTKRIISFLVSNSRLHHHAESTLPLRYPSVLKNGSSKLLHCKRCTCCCSSPPSPPKSFPRTLQPVIDHKRPPSIEVTLHYTSRPHTSADTPSLSTDPTYPTNWADNEYYIELNSWEPSKGTRMSPISEIIHLRSPHLLESRKCFLSPSRNWVFSLAIWVYLTDIVRWEKYLGMFQPPYVPVLKIYYVY